jgi:predicted component of type VI protein secretion system
MPCLTLAVARPQILASKGADPRPAKRTKLRPKDVEQSIQQAKNLCYNYEDGPACRVAWDRVEELSSELARQREDDLRTKASMDEREDPLECREYDV